MFWIVRVKSGKDIFLRNYTDKNYIWGTEPEIFLFHSHVNTDPPHPLCWKYHLTFQQSTHFNPFCFIHLFISRVGELKMKFQDTIWCRIKRIHSFFLIWVKRKQKIMSVAWEYSISFSLRGFLISFSGFIQRYQNCCVWLRWERVRQWFRQS